MIVAGIGCRAGCAAGDIVAAVREAEAKGGCVAAALAAPTFKRAEPGLAGAAAALDLTLHFIDDPAMTRAQAACVTRSGLALAATGFASVAEAAAIAAASGDAAARLLVPRVTVGGATCALAGS